MAVYNRYQYETSPRKLEPTYAPPKRKRSTNTRNSEKQKEQQKTKLKTKKNIKLKLVFYLLIGFAILFTISYRNSRINEEFSEVKSMQEELAQLEKENEQLNINIQNDLNLSQIEKSAKELLGMQKLTSKQTVNVNLSKKDYVEASSEEVIIEENSNWLTSIMNTIKNIF